MLRFRDGPPTALELIRPNILECPDAVLQTPASPCPRPAHLPPCFLNGRWMRQSSPSATWMRPRRTKAAVSAFFIMKTARVAVAAAAAGRQ